MQCTVQDSFKGFIKSPKSYSPDIISLNQSDFVPGRLIIDNVLLAYELTYYMQNKRKGVDGYAAIKLDMSKVMTVSSGDS